MSTHGNNTSAERSGFCRACRLFHAWTGAPLQQYAACASCGLPLSRKPRKVRGRYSTTTAQPGRVAVPALRIREVG